MPKIKKGKKYMLEYSEETLQKALFEIKAGKPKKTVALKYNIPRATLQFRLSKRFTKTEKGPATYLRKEEELELEQWIIESQRKGFPRRKIDIQLSVQQFLNKDRRKTPFKNNFPGDRWYNGFLKRHPLLTHRTPEAVTSASAAVSEKDLKKWFSDIELYLKEKGYFEILTDLKRVFNGDETNFYYCPKLGRVVAPKGAKNIYEVDAGDAKQNLTVMFTFSADGSVTPPMIIFPNKRLPQAVRDSVPTDWGYALTDNGWMKSETFLYYIEHVLHAYLVRTSVTLPIILFVDGHRTHLTYEVSQLCSNLKIILVALYPNATRILQPADVASFRPLKNLWRYGVLKWRRDHPHINLRKEDFAPILKLAVSALTPQTIANGFKACGIYPWNSSAIDFTKCLGKKDNKHGGQVSKEVSEKVTLGSEESISFDQFKNIVGNEKLLELQELNQTDDVNLNCLKQIYEEFNKNHNIEGNSNDIFNDSFIQIAANNESIYTEEQIANMPIVIASCNEDANNRTYTGSDLLEADLAEDLADTFFEGVTNPEQVDNVEMLSNALIEKLPLTKEKYEPNVSEIEKSCDINIGPDTNKVEVSEIGMKETSERMLKENEPKLLECATSKQSIGVYLHNPKTPERKYKRETKRVSFVITSSGFKQMAEDKEKRKIELEEEKAKRKQKQIDRQAERGKNLKSKKQTETKKTTSKRPASHVRNVFNSFEETTPLVTNISVENGLCFICVTNINTLKSGIKCQKCTRTYHATCLKKKGIFKFFFVCATCIVKI